MLSFKEIFKKIFIKGPKSSKENNKIFEGTSDIDKVATDNLTIKNGELLAKFNMLDAILSIENISDLEKNGKVKEGYRGQAAFLKDIAESCLEFNYDFLTQPTEDAHKKVNDFNEKNTLLRDVSKDFNSGYDSTLGQDISQSGRSYRINPDNVLSEYSSKAFGDSIAAKLQVKLRDIEDEKEQIKYLGRFFDNEIDAMELIALLKSQNNIKTLSSISQNSQDATLQKLYSSIVKLAENNYTTYAQNQLNNGIALKKDNDKESRIIKKDFDHEQGLQ